MKFIKNDKVQQDLILLKDEVAAIIKQLENDPTPESDYMSDPLISNNFKKDKNIPNS